MKRIDRRDAVKVMVAAAGLVVFSRSTAEAADPEQRDRAGGRGMDLKVPGSLKAEHDELHVELVRATKAGGQTGEAAQAVAKVLHPHFVKEEELAMPPLGLLPVLADGPVRPELAQVVELTDKLKKELPTMLKEHQAIVGALETLVVAATRENKPQARQLAEKLKQHAQTEEEVLYPAALLVGEYVKLKLHK
jgi:hypothetical protein